MIDLLIAVPVVEHDARCEAWSSELCDCRDATGHSAASTATPDDPFATRAELERAWHDMTLRERALQLDLLAAEGSLR